MALVAYDSSDDSDHEAEESPTVRSPVSCLRNGPSISEDTSLPKINPLDEEIEVIARLRRPAAVPDDGNQFLFQVNRKYSAIFVLNLTNSLDSEEEDDPVPVSFSHLPKPNFHVFNTDRIKTKATKRSSLDKPVRLQSKVRF